MLGKLINLIFPPKCIFCRKLLDVTAEMEICNDCFRQIHLFSENSRVKNTSSFCDEIVCVSEYSGIIKEALKRYKFNGKPSYCRAFSKLLIKKVKIMTNCRKFDIIVSVPLHKSRETVRGYNQALLISKIVSKATGIREESGVLKRVRETSAQSLISSRHGRLNNIKDAFKVTQPHKLAGKSIILIDDILTTGHTVDECSRALKEAGALWVTAAVIASGRKY